MKRYLSIFILLAGLLSVSCEEKYVASVTALQFEKVEPAVGCYGDIVKIYGRNFSDKFGENHVWFGDTEAKILEYNKWDLTVVVPKQAVGKYTVKVVTDQGEITGPEFEYLMKQKVTTILGSVNGHLDGVGLDAKLSYPEGVTMDKDGNLWITERGGTATTNSIRMMTPDGNLTTIAFTELPWHGGFNAAGEYHFAAKDKKAIYKVSSDGVAAPVAITGGTVNVPMEVKFDASDNMWICCRNDSKVLKVTGGQVVKTYDVKHPTCITFDASGRAVVGTNYELSNTSGELYVIDGDQVTLIADNTKVGFVGGICAAKDGSIYFGDITSKSVRRLVPGTEGDYLTGEISTITSGLYPSDVYLDERDENILKIYVACSTSFVVKRIDIY